MTIKNPRTLEFADILKEFCALIEGVNPETDNNDLEHRLRILAIRKKAGAYLKGATEAEVAKISLAINLLDQAYQDCVALRWLTRSATNQKERGTP